MGFISMDDWINEVTNNGKFFRIDWQKQLGDVGPFVAGRWYDMSLFRGSPMLNRYGELLSNGQLMGSSVGWTLGANWTYANQTLIHTAGAAETISCSLSGGTLTGQNYVLEFYASALGTSSLTASIGGVNLSQRTAAGSYYEITTTTASTTAGLVITPDTNVTCTLSNFSVCQALSGVALYDTDMGAIYHGGNVTPDTKHILNAGIVSAAANFVPGVWILVDTLLVYPGITMNTANIQYLGNTATLPRYTTGVGVQAYLVYTAGAHWAAGNPTSVASHAYTITYTNSNSTTGQTSSELLFGTSGAVAVLGQIDGVGIGANLFGPFIPLQWGDIGVKSVQIIQFSAAAAANNFAALVLCKPLLTIPNTTQYQATERDFFNQLPCLPRIYDGARLAWLFFPGAATAIQTSANGWLDVCWG